MNSHIFSEYSRGVTLNRVSSVSKVDIIVESKLIGTVFRKVEPEEFRSGSLTITPNIIMQMCLR